MFDNSLPRHTQRRRKSIHAGFVVVLALLVLSAFASYTNIRYWESAQEAEERCLNVRWSLTRIVALLTDTETGQRGYIITGDEAFLTTTDKALEEIPVEMEKLRGLLEGDGELQGDLAKLHRLTDTKIRMVRSNIAARREGGFADAGRQVASKSGKNAMDAIREHVGRMDTRELQRLKNRSQATDVAASRTRIIILAANLLGLVTAGFSAEQVRRGFADGARAKEIVERANRELEEKVEERTGELGRALKKLQAENRERRKLEAEMLEVSEREQRRIAEDLHDGQAQLLAGALHLMTALGNQLAGLPAAKEADNLKQLIREALEQTRSVARGLYPVKETPKGLVLALQDLATRTRKLFDLECKFENGDVLVQDHILALNLYRVAQEAVNNSVKHGKASSIAIALDATNESIKLQVADNGEGLAGDFQSGAGLGMRMMKHRADMIGGRLSVEVNPKGGLMVCCIAPRGLNAREDART